MIFLQHFANELTQVLAVLPRNRIVGAPQYFHDESFHGISVECVLESDHFVKQAPQGPNIRFDVVCFFLANLRAEVVRSSNSRFCNIVGVSKNPC